MIDYYFKFIGEKPNALGENVNHYQLCAIIDDKYYWETEWHTDNIRKLDIVETVTGGFITEEIIEQNKNLSKIDFSVLRDQFGSFAYFIERAVNGFKSYIIWISPDPQVNDIPWQILNN